MGFLGACWISAATVRGVAHTVALTVYSTHDPPGEKPSVIGVKGEIVRMTFPYLYYVFHSKA